MRILETCRTCEEVDPIVVMFDDDERDEPIIKYDIDACLGCAESKAQKAAADEWAAKSNRRRGCMR